MADPRTEPASVRVLLTTGGGVRIEWRDGHRSHYPFPYLRRRCPCATCRDQPLAEREDLYQRDVTPLLDSLA